MSLPGLEQGDPLRVVDLWQHQEGRDPMLREWLVTNGLGGYAAGTISGRPTRRYHGLLIAALPNPLGRVLVLDQFAEEIRPAPGRRGGLGWAPGPLPAQSLSLTDFHFELGLPVWRFEGEGVVLERRLLLVHEQNTTFMHYRLLEGPPVELRLRPGFQFRRHDAPLTEALPSYPLHASTDRIEIIAPEPMPRLRMHLSGEGSSFVIQAASTGELLYAVEESRGYAARGRLYSPGFFAVQLSLDRDVSVVASTEEWETVLALDFETALAAERSRRRHLIAIATPALRTGPPAELVLAADQFLIRPVGRPEDDVRARASGDEARTVIAGYHWFTDWGRDTMISLEGLTLLTGRFAEAGAILRTFGAYLRDGLVPNLFPEGESQGLYHTADATLWFVNAVDRYLTATNDLPTLEHLLPKLYDVIEHHLAGTRFGIGVDPQDGLLRQGAPGCQLTWMDAKLGDWVVTPRRGKAVEINALWYNALRITASWARVRGHLDRVGWLSGHAERAWTSFNRRFWNEGTQHLFDVVDGEHGDDPACRPNQLFALSLKHPVLEPSRWRPVLSVIEAKLLTPVGLRSLSPDHPDFKPTYHGDLRTRDAAYHQGTVWSWLIGPYVDASLRVWPERREAIRRSLEGLIAHLDDACIGTISEVFDAEGAFLPRGCVAQAWGVAELLRSLAAMGR